MIILGVDPGKSTGLATIRIEDKKIIPISMEVSKGSTTQLAPFVEQADIVVVENFLVRPTKARKGAFDWDPMITSRVIGAVELLCEQFHKKLVFQEPSIKPVGFGWGNMKYVAGKKGTHSQDALAHAVFYAVKNGLANPVKPA